MDHLTAGRPVEIQRWLPYWAVFQADVGQTLRSWIYRLWVLLSLMAIGGYLTYRVAPQNEHGVMTKASLYISDMLRWTVIVGAAMVVALTAGCISSERGTMADSVLSRGISRYQYFLGKWHARLATVLGTYVFMAIVCLVAGAFLLHPDDLSWSGSIAALIVVVALLAAVISTSVAMSAVVTNTMLGVTVLWIAIYGGGFALNFVPGRFPAPVRTLENLPNVLRGHFDLNFLTLIVGWSLAISVVSSLIGMIAFARRDV
jgi:putative exporter of polyketide antibiotics